MSAFVVTKSGNRRSPSAHLTGTITSTKENEVANSNAPTEDLLCDSAVELQLFAGDSGASLADTGYCIPDSIDADGLDGGCVVSRDKYRLATCNSAEGVRFVWENSQEAVTTLDGYYVKLRYLTDAYGE
jgi:hypothetical protein